MSVGFSSAGQQVHWSFYEIENHKGQGVPKLPDEAPLESLPISMLEFFENCPVPSSNKVDKRRITSGKEKDQIVYFKECTEKYPPILAQLEAASSASMRLTTGESSARVRPVVDDNGKVVGSASYEIPNFNSFAGRNYNAKDMLGWGIMPLLTGLYLREEGDFHVFQLGTGDGMKLFRVDFDELLYGDITANIKGSRLVFNGVTAPEPKDLFPITDRDIENFPDIQDARPCYWPTKFPENGNIAKMFPNRDEFLKINKEPNYSTLKYFAFLQELLIDPEEHIRVMTPYFERNEEGCAMIDKIGVCIKNRWEELTEVLINNEGFRKYLQKNTDAIKDVKEHFRSYNNNIALKGYSLNLDNLDKRFQNIVRRCMVQDLAVILLDLGIKLKRKQEDWEKFKQSYKSIIIMSINFETSGRSVLDAFLELERGCKLLDVNKIRIWQYYAHNIFQLFENYRGLVMENMKQSFDSFVIDPSGREFLSKKEDSLDLQRCMAKALQAMLEDQTKLNFVLQAVDETYNEYTPYSYSPTNYTRNRGDEIKQLKGKLKNKPKKMTASVSKFCEKGQWHLPGYMTWGSANPILISRLAEKVILDFKNQPTLKKLLDFDMVELIYAIDSKEWRIEESSKKIYEIFSKNILEKEAAETK